MDPIFNYLITVHNKEKLLAQVLEGVGKSASRSSRIIVVLDGCNDRSLQIASEFKAAKQVDTILVEAPDVHEIKAINIGLRQAKPGYCVILQDDVVLDEPNLERITHALCEQHQSKLGFISFRLAADVRPTSLPRRIKLCVHTRQIQHLFPLVEDHNLIGGPQEHLNVQKTPYGVFSTRMIGIKSPVCLTPELRKSEPFLDEQFAPYCYDDFDLSLRALKSGLINGLFPIHFRSDLDWGGTRNDPDFGSDIGTQIRLRNRRLMWKKHGGFLRNYFKK
jgi:glycosyltransferase involved in cell wall biosynthesis